MNHVYPEYALIAVLIAILLAIGVPAFHNGNWVLGTILLVLAGAVASWVLIMYLRRRRGD